MKNLSPALLALFSANIPFEQFDLYTITLRSGLVLRYANCQFDVLADGHTFLCSRSVGGVQIDEDQDSGPRANWTADLSTGSWSVNVITRDCDLIGDQPWLPAARAGILDEATTRVDRGYVSAWPDPPTLQIVPTIGTVNVFTGRVAELDFGRSITTIAMNDPRELLDVDMPRNLYSRNCRFALFGPGCGLDPAPFQVAAVVNGVTDNQVVNTTAGQVDDWFSLGEAAWVTGRNAGLRSDVRAYRQAGGTLELIAPMPFTISNGDQLVLLPGCDKSMAVCDGKFANLANFGGAPFIPAPETAL